MNSEEAATWINSPDNKTPFLSQFALDAALKPETYSLVVQFVPLHFRPNSDSSLQEVEEANQLPKNAILRAHWNKPAYHQAPEQTCGHVLIVMTKPADANVILTNRLVIFQKRVYTEKCKKEPTRCLKCHSWGYMLYNCQQPFSRGGGGVVVASQWLDSQFQTIIPMQLQIHWFNSPSLHEFQHLPIHSSTTLIVQHQA